MRQVSHHDRRMTPSTCPTHVLFAPQAAHMNGWLIVWGHVYPIKGVLHPKRTAAPLHIIFCPITLWTGKSYGTWFLPFTFLVNDGWYNSMSLLHAKSDGSSAASVFMSLKILTIMRSQWSSPLLMSLTWVSKQWMQYSKYSQQTFCL